MRPFLFSTCSTISYHDPLCHSGVEKCWMDGSPRRSNIFPDKGDNMYGIICWIDWIGMNEIQTCWMLDVYMYEVDLLFEWMRWRRKKTKDKTERNKRWCTRSHLANKMTANFHCCCLCTLYIRIGTTKRTEHRPWSTSLSTQYNN